MLDLGVTVRFRSLRSVGVRAVLRTQYTFSYVLSCLQAPELENAIDQSNMTYQDAARTVGLLRRQAHGNSSTPISHPLTLESDNPVQKRPQIQYENLPASSTSAASQQADRRVSSLPVTPTLIPIDQMSLVQQLRTKSLSQVGSTVCVVEGKFCFVL